MALTNYTDISGKISDWLNRTGHSDITANAEDFIILAQRRIMREVRLPPMEVQVDLTITAGRATIPAAMLDVKELIAYNGNTAWPIYRSTFADVKNKALSSAAGPQVFDTIAGNFEFGPAPSSGVTVALVYYQELAFIDESNATNWFSTYAPELILYAALAEAAVYLKDFEQEQVYDKKYESSKAAIMLQKQKAEWAGPVQVNVR